MSGATWRLHLVGAGAAGTTLGHALAASGVELGAVVRRDAAAAVARVRELGAGTARSFEELLAHGLGEDRPALALLAVPDDALAELAAALASVPWPEHSVALHLSGARSHEVLAALHERGVATGSCHPLRSFVDPARDAHRLAGTVFAIDGDDAARARARDVAARLGGRTVELSPEGRAAWHAGASHAANHLVALFDQALDLFEAAGVARDDGRAALLPLLRDVLRHLEDAPPADALTGPVARGDAEVVAEHLRTMRPLDADLTLAYGALARRALRLASPDLPPDLVRRLREILESAP